MEEDGLHTLRVSNLRRRQRRSEIGFQHGALLAAEIKDTFHFWDTE
jgi:hypothetical protein